MFFQISTLTPDADLSWILAKNPNGAAYERQVGGASTGRHVAGKFLPDGSYEVVVRNDGLLFFEEMRRRNEAAYVRPEPWIVCPSNMKGFATALRSALHGDVGKEISAERFFATKHLRAVIGPYPGDAWRDLFLALGLNVEVLEEGTKEAHTLVLTTIAPMSVTAFLQKIYISMTALTAKWAFFDKIDDGKLESYLRLTKDWLASVREPYNHVVIQRLTGYHKSLQARFVTLPEGEPETSTKDEEELVDEGRRAGVTTSLHEKRHVLILANIPVPDEVFGPDTRPPMKIVDFGSGEGKLFAALHERFPGASLIGIDASRDHVRRTHRKLRQRGASHANTTMELYHDNLLFPRSWEKLVGADVLIASEVIEHMRLADRQRFIRLITELLEPKVLFLTTPNIEANVPMFGMPEGELRHYDHKIEYTPAQFQAEVVAQLALYYDTTFLEVLPGEPIQPSFCIKAVRKDVQSSKAKGHLAYSIQRMSEPSYFPTTNVTVSARDMREGFTSYPFLENSGGIFYLGPTVAPVDYISELDQYLAGASEGGPYLEHPLAAFNYYKERGVHILIEQPKYMGSRGYAFIFRDPDQARAFGYEQPIVMNARSGGPFFKDPKQAMAIWQDVASKLTDDFIILDAEVLPWNLKAERLIARDFVLPGEAALLWRARYGTVYEHRNAEQYLRMVALYGADAPLELRAFHVLARGKVKRGKYKMQFDAPRYAFNRTHIEQLREIAELEGSIVKPAGHQIINLGDSDSKARSVQRWHEYCANGGEGFVYKPLNFSTMSVTGYPLQPALKVRGPDYLRIIYGMDYLSPEYFDRLKARGTTMKRLLAVQEQDIAIQILRTFINGNDIERQRAIGAFMGLEWAQATTIDKTL